MILTTQEPDLLFEVLVPDSFEGGSEFFPVELPWIFVIEATFIEIILDIELKVEHAERNAS